MERPEGIPEVFVIGGGGTGLAVYNRLQRQNIPFAAGILQENDVEYAAASALAACVFFGKSILSGFGRNLFCGQNRCSMTVMPAFAH